MKRIASSLILSFLFALVVLVFLAPSTSASPSSVSYQPLVASHLITQSITMTTISAIEVSPNDIFAVVGDRAIVGKRGEWEKPSVIAIIQPNENPWYHTITVTAVPTDISLSSNMIDVGEGRLYVPYRGNLLLVESDTITTLYRSPEPNNWYRCESDGKYVYCEASNSDTWSVVSFDTNVPTVVYTTSVVSWGGVKWTARELLFVSVSTRRDEGGIIETVCVTDFTTGSNVCRDRGPASSGVFRLALFPHLSTLYLQEANTLYVYSVPTLTLEATTTLPSDFRIVAYNHDWLLVHDGIVYTSPDTLYIYQPRQLQPPVLYKEILVREASVKAINNHMAIVGGAETSIIDFTSEEQTFYRSFSRQCTVVSLKDRLIFAYPRFLSVYSTTTWTENGQYLLSLTEIFTPVTDYDHRLLMMGSQHYYLFDFSSYPPGAISGTVSPDVASCLWKAIRGDYVYGTCAPQRSILGDRYKDAVYGYPATLKLSSMQIASVLNTPLFGPIVSSGGIYAFVTQTVGTNMMSLTLSMLSNDPENLSVVQTFSNSITVPSFWYWNTVDRYDRKMFIVAYDPSSYRLRATRWDLDTQQVITMTFPSNIYWEKVDDLYVYVRQAASTGTFLRGFSHDFTRYYTISPAISSAYIETAPPYVVGMDYYYFQVFMRPEISLPFKVYLPFVTRQ